MKQINTKNGIITYKEKVFTVNNKQLNIKTAKKNLLDVKKIIDSHQIKFGLIYGTLLGAIRENNFIEHDEDIDLFVLEEDKEDLLSILKEIIDLGFEVVRYDGKLLSIIRHDEYIDFYFFRKTNFFYRKCEVGLVAKAKYLEKTKDYLFLGELFQVPIETEKFLIDLYGKNWRIPIKNDPSMNHNRYIIIRERIKKHAPFLFKIISKTKKLLNN
ncbi:MAG: LicD family protein [Gelidibacter sp.]